MLRLQVRDVTANTCRYYGTIEKAADAERVHPQSLRHHLSTPLAGHLIVDSRTYQWTQKVAQEAFQNPPKAYWVHPAIPPSLDKDYTLLARDYNTRTAYLVGNYEEAAYLAGYRENVSPEGMQFFVRGDKILGWRVQSLNPKDVLGIAFGVISPPIPFWDKMFLRRPQDVLEYQNSWNQQKKDTP